MVSTTKYLFYLYGTNPVINRILRRSTPPPLNSMSIFILKSQLMINYSLEFLTHILYTSKLMKIHVHILYECTIR